MVATAHPFRRQRPDVRQQFQWVIAAYPESAQRDGMVEAAFQVVRSPQVYNNRGSVFVKFFKAPIGKGPHKKGLKATKNALHSQNLFIQCSLCNMIWVFRRLGAVCRRRKTLGGKAGDPEETSSIACFSAYLSNPRRQLEDAVHQSIYPESQTLKP
ncbi:hypothetical protein SAMN02745216_03478 [Desulfatibacillum alkenivorans DSM 16219]|uniref:Uncharacterized protein n=1 Tax=Desulfatibacillum alkenivorans DSM 16219 TaxID=1121393 RepID=A0A1M6SJB9_9BACT|nr:hypothetical protein SAMN02745216_03478 [Desulfatibacillum alkenivorans DSM 16219]